MPGKPLPFGEIELASAELSLRPLAILNIDTRSMPLDNLAAVIAHCYFVVQHPTIFPVGAEDASFMQEGFAAGQRHAPVFHDSFDILGMYERCPLPALQILQRPPDVPEPCLIEEIETAVGRTRMKQAGGRIDKELKVQDLVTWDRAVAIRDHDSYCIPAWSCQWSLQIPVRTPEPAGSSVCAQHQDSGKMQHLKSAVPKRNS
jgi:hypothetical protein